MSEPPKVLPKLKHTIGQRVVPGDAIGRSTVPSVGSNPIRVRLVPGPGTYQQDNVIFASTRGKLSVVDRKEPNSEGKDTMPLVEVYVKSQGGFAFGDQVIRKDQIVLCRVSRLSTQQIIVDIVANERCTLKKYQYAEGCIRREDIKTAAQASESTSAAPTTTTTILANSFQPGDYLVARVLSLGDPRRYFLTCAEPGLGVIFARSAVSGKPMIPISWKEMQCPETGAKEPRKCAKPQNLPAVLLDQLRLDQTNDM